jgi:hypothetical protein
MTVEALEASADNFVYDNPFTDEGDGIGYFGSAIADTVSLTITR